MRAPLGSVKILLKGFLFVVGIYRKWYNIGVNIRLHGLLCTEIYCAKWRIFCDLKTESFEV